MSKWVVGLAALTIFVYSSVHTFQFVNWDDPTYILENSQVLTGLSWETAKWALTTGHSPYWHPVTWLSHLLDVRLFGVDAGSHHLTSLMIHIANTLLVFALFVRMTSDAGRSAFVAAIFAVHPLHVESVAWVAERKDVLSTFFWALAILAYLRYVSARAWTWYVAMCALFVLALMAKPMVVTLPVVLLLLDIWPLRRKDAWTRLVLDKLPLIALSSAASVATVLIQNRVGAMASLDALPFVTRVANATVSYTSYMWKALWPVGLAAFYPLSLAAWWTVAAAATVLIAITALAIRYRQRHPHLIVGWVWYLVTLAPVIGLLQAGEQAMADRFMYVPLIGLSIIVAWSIKWTRATAVIAVAVVVAYAVMARAQVRHWSDSVALWTHATRVTPGSYMAHENLGQALRERGALDAALEHYEQALANAPSGSLAYQAVIRNSVGLVKTRQGRSVEAIRHFDEAVRLNPGFVEPQVNLANALAASGRAPEAAARYRAALSLNPSLIEARVGLGGVLLQQGQPLEATTHFQEALRLDPRLPQAHNGLGAALAMQERNAEARQHYAEALRLKPDLATARFNLAVLWVKEGKIDQAKRELQAALQADPGYGAARDLLNRLNNRQN